MVRKGVVEKKLERLRTLREEELTRLVIIDLVGMKYGALHKRLEESGSDYKNREDIALLIEGNRPLLEEWPQVSDLENLLHLGAHVFRHWYRNITIRERAGAVKILSRIFFDPNWFGEIKTKADKHKGGLITIREASEITGVDSQKLAGHDNKLGAIQPAGPRTMRFYSRSTMMNLKKRLDGIRDARLLTSEQVSIGLDARVEDVRDYIPHKCVHPLSGRFLYDPSVLRRYKDAVFLRCTPLHKIVEQCEKEIFNSKSVRKKVGYLIGLGKIPSERIEKINSVHYLSTESENMVRNIYSNLGYLDKERIDLVRVNDAAEKIGLSCMQLNSLIKNCGEEYLLTEDKRISYHVDVKFENRKVCLRPRIPYVRWAQRTTRYLTTPAVNALERSVKNVIQEASQRGAKPFDGYWYGRLAILLREDIYAKR